MAQEVITDSSFRVVRDSEQGMYLLQVGFGNHFRTFSAMKTGKLDAMRQQAKDEAQQAVPVPAPPEQ